MRVIGICQGGPIQGSPICYEFYEPSLAHYFQEREGSTRAPRKIHIQFPKGPFYTRNTHLLRGIQALCTTLWKCTL